MTFRGGDENPFSWSQRPENSPSCRIFHEPLLFKDFASLRRGHLLQLFNDQLSECSFNTSFAFLVFIEYPRTSSSSAGETDYVEGDSRTANEEAVGQNVGGSKRS